MQLLRSLVLLLILTNAVAQAEDPDPIQDKLTTAQKKYDEVLTKYRDQARMYWERRDEMARQAGNKKLVDLVKAERAEFDRTDVLPANAPVALRQIRLSAAKELEQAYAAAAKEFLKAKKDDQADFAEKSAACLRRYGMPLPEWGVAYPPGIYFLVYAKKDRAVLELRPNRTFSRNKEGKDFTHGSFEIRQGKLILRSEDYVTVVIEKDGNYVFQHFFPAKNYPNGKSSSGAMIRTP